MLLNIMKFEKIMNYAFLNANGFIEHKIQKGFLPKLSGTFEHTAQMVNIINTARIKQRAIVITLLDLKNVLVSYITL